MAAVLLFTTVPDAIAALSATMIAESNKVVIESSRVTCIRGGDLEAVKVIQGMALAPGDMLMCGVGDVVLVLADSTRQYAAVGPFRAYIGADEKGECFVEILAGETQVRANGSSALHSAWGNMSSQSTIYGMRIAASDLGAAREYYVLDGSAVIQSRGDSAVVGAGHKAWGDSLSRLESLTATDLEKSADLNANLDVSAALAATSAKIDRDSCFEALRQGYVRTFADPLDVRARLDLAAVQVGYRVVGPALYQTRRVEELSPPTSEQARAQVALIRSSAYGYLGRVEDAKEQLEIAQRLDGTVLSPERLRTIRRDSSWVVEIRGNVDAQAQLFELLAHRRYKEAIQGFEDRVRARKADSRDHFGLSEAYEAIRNHPRACQEVALALELNESDQRLSREEVERLARRARSCRTDPRFVPRRLDIR